MGVGEDPVGEDGVDIDAPAWPPADVEAADEGMLEQMGVIGQIEEDLAKSVLDGVEDGELSPTARRAFNRTGLAEAKQMTGCHGMCQEDRRQALVPIPSNFGRGLRPSFAVSKKSKGSGKVTVQSGWVMEDCLHHMETFSILNAGPLLEEARMKAIIPEKELASPAVAGRGGLDTQRGANAPRPGQRGAKARRPGQRGANAPRPGQRGAKARRPGQRGAKARRPGQRGANAPRPGQRGAKARRPGQRSANARRPGRRGANARRPGQRGANARRPGQRGANASGMGGAAVATE
eukprot:jgi/Tetstr1/432901/TSEL_002343.t1